MDAGLFGGTFNPFHNGHLGIIDHVKQYCGLERIYLYPSATPPHKSADNLAPAMERLEMVRSSVQSIPHFFVSDIEIKRQGPSFTIDTIEAFQAIHGPHINFHLLMGSDAFFDITTWKEKDRIFKAVPIIVMVRGEPLKIQAIASFIDEHIAKGYKIDHDGLFIHNQLRPIRICKVPRIDISSTQIRNRVHEGKPIHGLVPEHVETLIRKKELYK